MNIIRDSDMAAALHNEGLRAWKAKAWDKACTHFSEAADIGHAPSQTLLAMAKWHGEGSVKKSIPQAIELFRKAGKQGTEGASAAFFLGSAYARGDQVEKDRGRAVRWLSLAAKHDHAEAKFVVGMLLIGPHLAHRHVEKAGKQDPPGGGAEDEFAGPPDLISLADDSSADGAAAVPPEDSISPQSRLEDFSKGAQFIQAAAEQGHIGAKEFCKMTASPLGDLSVFRESIGLSQKVANGDDENGGQRSSSDDKNNVDAKSSKRNKGKKGKKNRRK